MGGRQVRVGKDVGEIFDHHAVEFTYANGVKMFSYCRQIPGCWNAFSEHAHGTKGHADIEGHGTSDALRRRARSPCAGTAAPTATRWKWTSFSPRLLAGQPYNEADRPPTAR